MPERTQTRVRAIALFTAPVVMLVAIILHPYLEDELDIPAVAAEVVANPDRWVWAHVMLMLGFGFILFAVFALREVLRSAGEDRWSFIAVPLLVGGSTVFIAVWGMEITVASVAELGGDVEAVFEDSDRWFGPIGLAGYGMFFLGWLSMALAARSSKMLGRRQTWAVIAATVVMFAGLSFPATAGAYLFSFGLMGFTWILGYQTLWGANRLADRSTALAAAQQQ